MKKDIKIISPCEVKEDFVKALQKILSLYDK